MSGNASGKPFKVGEVVVQVGGDTDVAPVSVGDTKLEGTKESSAAQNCRSHEAELAQDALLSLKANASFSPEVIKDDKDLSFVAVSEFKRALGRIEDPTKDLFSLCPATVTFQSFLL